MLCNLNEDHSGQAVLKKKTKQIYDKFLTAARSANKFRCEESAPPKRNAEEDRHISTPLPLEIGYSCQAVGYQTV